MKCVVAVMAVCLVSAGGGVVYRPLYKEVVGLGC